MHEDVIPGSKDDVDRVHICQDKANHNFGGYSEVHIKVMHALSKDRFSSGLADDVVEELTDEVGVEVTRLSIFYGLGSETDWSVGVGRDLLDVTG